MFDDYEIDYLQDYCPFDQIDRDNEVGELYKEIKSKKDVHDKQQ